MIYYGQELYHHGILGQKWGRRRYQYQDGSYTPEGRERRNQNNEPRMSRGKKAAVIGMAVIGTIAADSLIRWSLETGAARRNLSGTPEYEMFKQQKREYKKAFKKARRAKRSLERGYKIDYRKAKRTFDKTYGQMKHFKLRDL